MVEQADEISMADALAFQAMYQKHYADNAVSYTVNVEAQPHQQEYMLANPFGTDIPAPTEEYLQEVMTTVAYRLPALKGTTIMVDGTRVQAPYTRISEAAYADAELTRMVMVGDGIDENCATGACPVR